MCSSASFDSSHRKNHRRVFLCVFEKKHISEWIRKPLLCCQHFTRARWSYLRQFLGVGLADVISGYWLSGADSVKFAIDHWPWWNCSDWFTGQCKSWLYALMRPRNRRRPVSLLTANITGCRWGPLADAGPCIIQLMKGRDVRKSLMSSLKQVSGR